MARISGLEKKDAPWHLRWFYGVMRKMFGKDFTPAKIQMRLPGLAWGDIAMEAVLGRKRIRSVDVLCTHRRDSHATDTSRPVARAQICHIELTAARFCVC